MMLFSYIRFVKTFLASAILQYIRTIVVVIGKKMGKYDNNKNKFVENNLAKTGSRSTDTKTLVSDVVVSNPYPCNTLYLQATDIVRRPGYKSSNVHSMMNGLLMTRKDDVYDDDDVPKSVVDTDSNVSPTTGSCSVEHFDGNNRKGRTRLDNVTTPMNNDNNNWSSGKGEDALTDDITTHDCNNPKYKTGDTKTMDTKNDPPTSSLYMLDATKCLSNNNNNNNNNDQLLIKIDDILVPNNNNTNFPTNQVRWYWKENSDRIRRHRTDQVLPNTTNIAYSGSLSNRIERAFRNYQQYPSYQHSHLAIDINEIDNIETKTNDNVTKQTLRLDNNDDACSQAQYLIDFSRWMQISFRTRKQRTILRKYHYCYNLLPDSMNYKEAKEYFIKSLRTSGVDHSCCVTHTPSLLLFSLDLVDNFFLHSPINEVH